MAFSTVAALEGSSASSVAVPQQMVGSATGLPSLLSAMRVPAALAPSDGWRSEVTAPMGAVPAEDRTTDSAPAAPETDGLPPGVARAEAADRSVLAVPNLVDVYPKPGYLVDSLTPSLRAWGKSNNGSNSTVSYSFKLCDIESMSGAGCTTSGYVAGNGNSWTVPAAKLAWGKQYWWTVTIKDSFDSSTTTSSVLTFTTGVRPPVVTSQLASSGVVGQEFNQQTGNYTTTLTDLTVATVGPPLSVVRTYNSLDPRTDGMFGAGWSTRWDMKVVKEVRGASTSALVTYPDGRQVRFRANGDGTFQPPPAMYATLAEQSGGWRLMDKTSTSYRFDTAGRLTSITDQRGRGQTLTYDAGGKLAKVTGVGGRSVTFTWQGIQVATISSDPVDGQALTWNYSYDAGRLTQVCAPVAAPNCTTYEYGGGSLYRSSVLNSDPFGYWRLGEALGASSGEDLGSGAGDLTTYQGITLAQPGALAGTTDTSATFKTGSVVKLPSNTIPHLGDQVSVEAWFKTAQSGVIMAAGTEESSSLAKGAMLYVGTDGKLRGSLDAATSPITSAAAVNNDQWHHVALTVAGQNQTLYLDGQQVGTMTGTATGWRTYATIGNGVTDPAKSPAVPATAQAFPFQGQLDEVALYGKPLTAAEVASHYAARTGAPHKLTKVTLPSGRLWAVNTYDDKTDRIATHTDSDGGTWKIGNIDIEQQSGEAQVTVTDPDNITLDYLYDAWRGYRIRREPDQRKFATWYEYDQAGFLKKIIDRNDIANEIYQDKRGNTLGRQYCRTPSECAIEYWSYYLNANDPFDPRNDRVTTYRNGRSANDTDNTYATTTEYNSYGEHTKQTTPATADFPQGRSVSIAYTDGSEAAVGGGATPAGLVKTKSDARGSQWSYRYTAAGDLAEQTEPEGLVSKLDYDPLGRLIASTRISQAVPNGAKTTFAYDGCGRLLTSTAPPVKNEISNVTHTAQARNTYDPDGNVLTETIADLTGGEPERTTTNTYDTHGRQDSVTNPEGGITRQVWNHRGWPVRTTDPRGTVIEQSYTERGEPYTQTLKGWTDSPVNPQAAKDVVLESRGYDAGGRLTSIKDVMGRKTTNVYWMDNRLKEQIADDARLNDPNATPRDVIVKAEEYDPAGNLTEQVTGINPTTGNATTITTFKYDAASRLTRQVLDPDKLARTTDLAYDANDNATKTTLTAAGTTRTEMTSYAYNKLNQPTKQTIENGTQDIISTTTYDDRGLPVATTDPRGNADGANAADYTTTLRYDILDRLVETTAPQVQVNKNGTTTSTRPAARVGYDTVGNQTHQTDAEGRTLVSTFDKVNRLTSSTAPAYTPPGGSAITSTVRHAYDTAGQLKSTTDPRGYVTSYEYDQLGRQVRVTDPAPDEGQTAGTWVTEYDMAGEKLATVDPTGARSQATYDDLGRQITATQIERKPASAAYTTKMEYDDVGRLIKQTVPGSGTGTKSTSFTRNAAGEVETVTDPAGNVTTEYDLAGRPVKAVDANDNASVAEYDLAGRKVTVKDLHVTDTGDETPLRTYGYGYDLAGNQISATSPEGHVTRQTFDALNRLTSLIEPVSASQSITTSYGYDANGARTRITDGRGNATWTSYNSLGLVETVTEPSTTAHPNAADRTWTHVYDEAGNPKATIQPGGVRIDRTFDRLGRLTKESGAGGGAATAEHTFGYDLAGRGTTAGDLTVDYNDRGLPLKVSRGTVQETAYAYDGVGSPIQRIDAAGTATFTYDTANRLKTATDPVTSRTLTYGYDAASRLGTITATSGTASTQTIDYDEMDRVKSQTLKNASGTQLAKITYGWDKDDNLTTKTTAGTAGAGTNTYGYDHAGRLTSWTAPGGAVTTYEWDAAGNRTKAGNATFTYDERNRLTNGDGTDYTYTPRGTLATSTKAGATTQYTFDAFDRLIADGDSLYSYDALDRMTSRIRGTAKHTFAYSGLGNGLAAITDSGGTVQAKYARDLGGGLLGLKEGAGAAVAALSDLHGDLVATFTTAVQSSTAYDPFGTVTAQTGTKNRLGFQGEYTDPDTGKVNMHARWYQPGTGTFTSRDTATLNPSPSVQANRYTYANASPLTGTDPTGHATVIGGGSVAGPSAYTPGVDYQTAADIYAQHGIMMGGGSSGGGGTCIGSCYGGGAVEMCLACITAGEIKWDVVSVMTVEEMKRQNVLPNGTIPWDGFWDAPKKTIRRFVNLAYAGLSDGQLQYFWEIFKQFGGKASVGLKAAAAARRGPDNGPSQEYKTCAKTHSASYCVKHVEEQRKWRAAYMKAVEQVADQIGRDRVNAALSDQFYIVRDVILDKIDAQYCKNLGSSCGRGFAYMAIMTMGIVVAIGNHDPYDMEALDTAVKIRNALQEAVAKGDEFLVSQLSKTERAAYEKAVSEGKWDLARAYAGTMIHKGTYAVLEEAYPKRFSYTGSGTIDFYDHQNNVHAEVTTFRAYNEHLNRKNPVYRFSPYILYKIGRLPASTIRNDVTGRRGGEER
ncbi:LamG-like jellyroll fold domain-containing protein [Nonomuraea jabiensis]|uniref:RHS repeat-associated protein n=1 Tax=Nonomuraea jabiensis TaxID=882448 RepID=A0A7W9L7Z6_9ACTN|nr:LamG-like jellyroll fold domain-containing protein [Nonomuraea jabiensis]MBB5774026.1 RHS repeat-associated protein [Nonomuraea jabiensis]